VPSRPAALLDTRRASAGRTAGAVAAGVAVADRMRLELGVELRTGVGPGRRAVVAVVVGTAAAGSCSLRFVEVHRREVAVGGRRCMCYQSHICCR
jgi:hypothetical protein